MQTVRYRTLGILSMLVLTVFLLSACGGSSSSPGSQSGSPEQGSSTPNASGAATSSGSNPAPAQEEPYKVDLYTTSFGSAGYVLAQGIADIVNKNNPRLNVRVVETSGTADAMNNTQSPDKQQHAIAAYATTLHSDIVSGKPPMQQPGEFHLLMALFDGGYTMVTLDPKIQSPEDFIGKSVNVGTPSAIGPLIPGLLEVWGVRDKVKEVSMGQDQAKSALLDGTLDISMFTATRTGDIISGSPALQEVLAQKGAHLIDFNEEDVNKLKEKYPEAIWMEAPKGSFGFDHPTGIIASINGYAVHPNFPEDIAYEFVKTLVENNDKLQEYHAYGKNILDKNFFVSLPTDLAPYNEGAVKYYKEAGIWKE